MVASPAPASPSILSALRYALPCWAAIVLLCALLPASLQQQWGLLVSSWFWALLALLAWRGQHLAQAAPRRRKRSRHHRGATPLPAARIANMRRHPGHLTAGGAGLRRANARASLALTRCRRPMVR